MRWQIIRKQVPDPMPGGTYRNWKDALREEGGKRCVYCAIPEACFGGPYNYHVEHFEPKSKAPDRTNDWMNLFYACAICNVFKGNDWPNATRIVAYPDPSVIDYETVFQRNEDGTIGAVGATGKYMIERLYLNRPQLCLTRSEAALLVLQLHL